jgi:hypothetical protein
MMDLFCRAGIMFGCEPGVVFVSPNSTVEVELVEYAVKCVKWADIFFSKNLLEMIIRCKEEGNLRELFAESEEDRRD